MSAFNRMTHVLWLAFRASRRSQQRALGRTETLAEEEARLEPDWLVVAGDDVEQETEAQEETAAVRAQIEDGDEEAAPETYFTTAPTQSQRMDRLHRGQREPLASMGM